MNRIRPAYGPSNPIPIDDFVARSELTMAFATIKVEGFYDGPAGEPRRTITSHIRGGTVGYPFISLRFKNLVQGVEGIRLPSTVQISAADPPSLIKLRRVEADIKGLSCPAVDTFVEKHRWRDNGPAERGDAPYFLVRHIIRAGASESDLIVRSLRYDEAIKPRSPRKTLDKYA